MARMMDWIQRRKVRQSAPRQRDGPTSWLCTLDAYEALTTSGYTRLADCPEVRMCVHAYADLISSMTLYLMRNTEEGDVREVSGLSRKLDIEPNAYMTRKTWMYNIVYTMMLPGDGNQVTYPTYAPDGMIDQLVPLKPSMVTFEEDTRGMGYRIRYGDRIFSPDEVLHFRINPDPEQPWKGTGYRASLQDVAKGLKQAGTTKRKLLESPAPSIIVKVDGLTEEFSSPEGRTKLRKQYLDSSENGLPWMIPAEAFNVETIKPLTMTDLAIKENTELDKRTIAGLFGVPAFLVGVGEYNKDEYNNFINTRIMPMAKNIEQELTRKLLLAPDRYWRFNSRALYAYDLGEVINAGKEMADRMALDRNEWRDWVGLSPRADMKELLALENYIPADKLGQQNKLKGGNGNDD